MHVCRYTGTVVSRYGINLCHTCCSPVTTLCQFQCDMAHSTGRHLILIYVVEKRKGELLENPSAKTKRVEKNRCSDLVVLGLPWKCTEDDLRKHFSQFGELLMVQVCELSFDFTLLRGSAVQCKNVLLTTARWIAW